MYYVFHRVVTALLLAKPAIINDEDESGNSALHLAALNGHPKIIDILIDYGASVDPRNSVLWTPLDCAAAKGNVESVLKLLERDSPIDPIDLAYTTPLHLASREGHEAVVKALLEQGADPLLLDHAGKNALDMAIENTHKYVTFLVSCLKCSISIPPVDVRKPLVFSLFQGVWKENISVKWVKEKNTKHQALTQYFFNERAEVISGDYLKNLHSLKLLGNVYDENYFW